MRPPKANPYRAEHSDDVVTVTLLRGHKGPATLILDIDQYIAYTGFGFSERQAPDESKTEADRLDQIRQHWPRTTRNPKSPRQSASVGNGSASWHAGTT